MRFFSGFTLAQVGEFLDMPISTVKSREDAILREDEEEAPPQRILNCDRFGHYFNHKPEHASLMSERIQTSTIIDFAHGRLTPEESLGLLKSIEEDPRASEELDLVVDLMNEAADPQSRLFAAPASLRNRLLFAPFGFSSIDTAAILSCTLR